MAEEQSEVREVSPPTLPETPRPIHTVPSEESPTVQHIVNSPSEGHRENENPKIQPRQFTARTVFHQRRGDDDTM